MGSCVSDQAATNSITAWYAPAMDTHRSEYAGRNFEYYSEDGTLAAYTAAAEVSGAREKGLLVYIKHFFLNEQESRRAFVHTYSNEQAIREIYLGILRGYGNTRIPMILSLTGMVVVRQIYLAVSMSINRTIENVYFCYPMAWGVTAALIFIYYQIVKKRYREDLG